MAYADWLPGRPSPAAHRPPIGHGHGIELQVQLVGEIERHLLGPLRFHDALILAENHALEFLQRAVGIVEVVVAPDDAVTAAAIRLRAATRRAYTIPLVPPQPRRSTIV